MLSKKRIIEYFQANNIEIPKLRRVAVKGSIFGIFGSVAPWHFVMKEVLKETKYYLEVFRRLEEQATKQYKELFEYVVAHEVAIAQFAQMELANNGNNSLETIEALLNN